MDNITKRINIVVDADKLRFIKWLAKRDGVTLNYEMAQIFQTELSALCTIMADEYFKETGDVIGDY